MYKMLTQKSPFTIPEHSFQSWYQAHHYSTPAPFPRYINLPKELENLIMKCLEKSPDRRPRNMGEILRIITPLEREYNQPKSSEVESNSGFFPQNNSFARRNSGNLQSSAEPKQVLSLQEFYNQSTWPDNKPQKKIVFPCLNEAKEGRFTSLWTMLDNEEIKYFKPDSALYFNYFLFQINPHPMILWINLLYNRQYEPKWLPCYLDLKNEMGYQIVANLIKKKLYHILLFALAQPQKYQDLLTVNVHPDKTKQLQNFILKTASWQGKNQPEKSKIELKKQFESAKYTILNAIERPKS